MIVDPQHMANEEFWSSMPLIHVEQHSCRKVQEAVDALPVGGTVILPRGQIRVEETIFLGSNLRINGHPDGSTELYLESGASCHFFTNRDPIKGNVNIALSDLMFDGNMENQERRPEQKKLCFSCGIYFANIKGFFAKNIFSKNIRQTALHLNRSSNGYVENLKANRVGWSGFSTSDGSKLYVQCEVFDAGLDKNHSGIHIDGGRRVFLKADVSQVTGNGIMVDSTFTAMSLVRIIGNASKSKRGLSFSGNADSPITDAFVSGNYCNNRETGIMISNSEHIIVSDASVKNNGEVGILLQGRHGGRHSVISGVNFAGNRFDIEERHESRDNYFINNSHVDPFALKIRKK